MNRWALVEFMHKLPEWQDPCGSALPISYADVLRGGNKSEDEIRAVEEELEAVAAAETLFLPA